MKNTSNSSKTERTEQRLKESESRYRCLFENHHTVMLIIKPETGEIIDANPAALSFYGWSYEDIVRKTITEINILSKQEVFQEIENANKKQQKHFLFKHRLSNGEIRHVEVHSAPIIFSDKKYLYSIVHDITDKIKNEKTRLEKEKLTAAISAIGAVCHEMNQPLMSIMGFAELLLEKSSMSKMEISYLKEIKTQTERLGRITKKLMNITQYKTKKYLKSEIMDIEASSKK